MFEQYYECFRASEVAAANAGERDRVSSEPNPLFVDPSNSLLKPDREFLGLGSCSVLQMEIR
jgi:hypothetical protein